MIYKESLGWLFFLSFGGCECVGNFVVCNRKIIFYGKDDYNKIGNQWLTGKEYAGGVATEGGSFIAKD